jgi:hypothetical protein
VKTGSNLAKSSKEGCMSKGTAFPMMMVMKNDYFGSMWRYKFIFLSCPAPH